MGGTAALAAALAVGFVPGVDLARLVISAAVPAVLGSGLGALLARRLAVAPVVDTDQGRGFEAERLRAAFDASATKLMICDGDGRVLYVNAALLAFFSEAQDDFRAAFPGRSARDMLGLVMQRLREDRGEGERREMTLGARRVALRIAATGEDESGGCIVEWQDVTRTLAVTEQAQLLAEAAGEGDFSGSLPVPDGPLTLRMLAEALNAICGEADRRMTAVADGLEALAAGDFGAPTNEAADPAIGKLARTLRETATGLREQVATLLPVADDLAMTAEQVSSGAADIAREIGATREANGRVAEAVRHSAGHSGEAAALAGEAIRVAEDGKVVVSGAVAAIGLIEGSSMRIGEIVGVIDQIAFQTNLLALNAAVEAARAGDAGRGFAVVASEVRALAQRSAQAAKDINGLISTSHTQVGDGVRLARDAGAALDRIVIATRKVSDTVARVTDATTAQAGELDTLNRTIGAMQDAARRNAEIAAGGADLAEALALGLAQAAQTLSPHAAAPRDRAPLHAGAASPSRSLAAKRETRRPRAVGAGRST